MQAWEAFLREQEKELGKETVQRWLRPLKVVNFAQAISIFRLKIPFRSLVQRTRSTTS
jgi:chromosomal replication initiator protein